MSDNVFLAVVGQSFHWMLDKDQAPRYLSALVDVTEGSVGFVTPWSVFRNRRVGEQPFFLMVKPLQNVIETMLI